MATSLITWPAHKRAMSRNFLGIVGRPARVLDIERGMAGELGYTSKDGDIHLAEDGTHQVTKSLSEVEQVAFTDGVFAHETLHQVFTDFYTFERKLNSYKMSERQIFATLFNLTEDSAIENFAPCVMGGTLLKSLRFTIAHIYQNSQPIDKAQNALNQFFSALIQFGDMGLIKGEWTFPEARTVFAKIAPLFEECVHEKVGAKRVEITQQIMELSKPIWEQAVKDAEEMEKLMKELKKSLKSSATGNSRSHGSTPDEDPSESSSKTSERRKMTITKVTKEELEEMKKNGEISEGSPSGSGNGDGDVNAVMCDEDEGENSDNGSSSNGNPSSSSASSENSSGKSSGSSASPDGEDFDVEVKESEAYKKAKEAKTANDGNGDEDEDDGEASKEGDKGNDDEKSSEKSSENSKKSDKRDGNANPFRAPHSETGNYNANVATPEGFKPDDTGFDEITEEEYTISEEDLNAITSEIERAEEEYRKEQEMEASVPEIDDFPVSSPKLGKKRCLNYRVTVDDDRSGAALEESYSRVIRELGSGIKTLTTQLRRIFENDQEESEYRCSGRISTKRLYSGRVSARVFSRKVNPVGKSDFAVELLVDESGSMSYGNKDVSARYACIALAEVFNNLGIPCYIIGFTADTRGYDIVHNHYITWKNTHNERLKLLNIAARANNCDGYSIRYATEVLKKNKSANKLLIVLSDGQPAASGYYDGVADTRQAIRDAKKSCSVLGVAIGNADTETIHHMYEKDFLHISHIDDLFAGLSKTLQKTMKSWGE